MTFGGNIPYTAIGQNWPRFGYLVNNRWQFSNDLTWVKGRHTRQDRLRVPPPRLPVPGLGPGGNRPVQLQSARDRRGSTAAGNNLDATGDPFASFLLGQVHDSNQTIPVYPTFNEAYTAAWVNDEFKVNDRLTLTLGLRFDYQFARTETENQYSTFDPNTPNPGRATSRAR